MVCLDLKTGEKTWDRPYDLTGSGGTKLGLAYQDGRVLAFGHYSNHDEDHTDDDDVEVFTPDYLALDGISYTFPIGDSTTAFVGFENMAFKVSLLNNLF